MKKPSLRRGSLAVSSHATRKRAKGTGDQRLAEIDVG